ncbi:hypothetical protein AAC387_Pa03g2752 [Persea americana]
MGNPEEIETTFESDIENADEASPLLNPNNEHDQHKCRNGGAPMIQCGGAAVGWAADGLPQTVVGEPLPRGQWSSSLFSCLGRNDEFCSSDLEVCVLGSFAPYALYGSNVERLEFDPGAFASHCLPYTGLYLLGNFLFGWNCLAPWFSYPNRTAIRQKFNLEGSCEAWSRSCGCCSGIIKDEVQREHCESACDFATHLFCHPCSLCQEGRELRRRMPHPGFNGHSVLVMIPPAEQMMGHRG